MRTLLLAITIILATTIAKAQQYQYQYTEITIKKFPAAVGYLQRRLRQNCGNIEPRARLAQMVVF